MAGKVVIGNAELWHEPRGEAHHAWLGDGVSVKGGRTRALRAFPDVGPCHDCGDAPAERHHKDGNTANNTPSNIGVLCRRCHMLVDGRMAAFRRLALENLDAARDAAAKSRRDQELCKRGHPLSGENLFINSGGSRGCKQCRRIHKATHRSKTRGP
jgi:hypothetical protein